MFRSFDESGFYKAIEEKDYLSLKVKIISAIRNNPEFKNAPGETKSEAEIAWNLLKERVPDMFENYREIESENIFNIEENVYNRDVVIKQSILLKRNFCQERFDRCKQIGRKITNYKESEPNFTKPQEQTEVPNRPGSQSLKSLIKGRKSIPWIAGGIVTLLLIVLVVVLAVEK